MKIVLFVGAFLIAALLCWGIVAGAHIDDDDEKAYSGLLEDD